MDCFWNEVIEPLARSVRPSSILAVGLTSLQVDTLRKRSEALSPVVQWAESSVTSVAFPSAGLVLLAGQADVVNRVLTALDAQASTVGSAFPITLIDLQLGGGDRDIKHTIENFAARGSGAFATAFLPVFDGLAVLYRKNDPIEPATRGLIEQMTFAPIVANLAATQATELRLARKRAAGYDRVMRDNQAAMADLSNRLSDAQRLIGRQQSEIAEVDAVRDSLRTELDAWNRSIEGRILRRLRNIADRSPRAMRMAGRAIMLVNRLRPATRRKIREGIARQREEIALIRASGLLDADWYRRTYPDVATAGHDPALHYLEHGVADGRDPGPDFSTSHYLSRYPDVAKSGLNPLVHYLRYGQAEEREKRSA